MKIKTDIAVVGGGASGLSAAIAAKTESPSINVVIAERLERVASKILATGGGRCNLGNKNLCERFYHGSIDAMKIIKNTPDAVDFFADMGVLTASDSEGRIYPASYSAATVSNALRLKCASLGVREICGFNADSITGQSEAFEIFSGNDSISCRRLIICAGGYAAPRFGTDGSIIRLFRERGYKIAKITPAAAPLKVDPGVLKGLKGIRVKGSVRAFSDKKLLGEEQGEIQFTDNSLSGICVFNMAHFLAEHDGKLRICLDLLPDMSNEQLMKYLEDIRRSRGDFSLEEFLTGAFVKNLALYIVKRTLKRPLSEKISALSHNDLFLIARNIKCLEFHVQGSSPWQNAQATRGGIHASCINDELGSSLEKGIFFAGEILDTVGDCGGYNLQWAWSSGTAAGRNCARSLKGERR